MGFFKALDRRMEGTFKIAKVERPRFIEELGTIVGGGKMLTTTWFETTPESGTLVTFKVEYSLGSDIPETERISAGALARAWPALRNRDAQGADRGASPSPGLTERPVPEGRRRSEGLRQLLAGAPRILRDRSYALAG